MGRLAYGVEKGLSQYSNPETLYQSLDSYSTLYPCRTQNPKPTLPRKAVVPNPASTFLKSFGDSPGCANAGGKGFLGLGFSPESRQYFGRSISAMVPVRVLVLLVVAVVMVAVVLFHCLGIHDGKIGTKKPLCTVFGIQNPR